MAKARSVVTLSIIFHWMPKKVAGKRLAHFRTLPEPA
ncbi:hypothetical protein EHW99_1828 [Erwinia amylovora]|uniref:Uncharacterized protein n=2 Tax=Erwinia amylovora TaxID=552 RepID=D4I2K0_ERWAC|nr:hypothetical protein EaACW_1762 [Erwinia amylovora ACW56400]QJQ54532.1 hypothetical protein EHX00_1828 [Erwinia amylovora]CBA20706.1 hypothetical protein predicted by Glimmer/Critica [Erwinia amylovora CFBP1430]CBX80626.1 hypothetical protein predicted by Glimmer/Critica [Erwinia amylovora ATCC BAA-2158]CCO78610.1 hypothetical protein BN432_1812 [Erwinia amylovora Ea356]CCO82404.1 hypothetical protein BN433_1834 [Erwinia amylovora Ea266]CCO86190.1 hypothetical protein BN434_1802 [Erwinia a